MIHHLDSNRNNLDSYLKNNTWEIVSFFKRDNNELESIKFKIDDITSELEDTFNKLNFEKHYNSLFILTLLDYSEKFRIPGAYKALYNIAINNNLSIGDRQKASKIFLLETNLQEDHFSNISRILTLLENAYLTEEDNEKNVLFTLGNYILNAIYNTIDVDINIITSIINHIKNVKCDYKFLSFEIIDKIISIKPQQTDEYTLKIKSLFEENLVKNNYHPIEKKFIVETDTVYSKSIKKHDYSSIRKISIDAYRKFSSNDQSKYYYELLRGVKIIDSEEQLFTYLTLFGKKHKTKLDIALSNINSLPIKYNVIDWACGQGLATMMFIEKYGSNNIQKVILNEPSELALKRASLHVKGYNKNINLITIKKTINQLDIVDISSENNLPNVHLFSNILDMDLDLAHLTNLIEKSCNGLNYFICVSPYTPREISTVRIDFFMHHFKNKFFENYNLIKSKNIKNGDPTMVLRVFSVTI